MAKFEFRLASLLKLREAERQQRRLELAEAFRAEQLLKAQAEQLAIDLRGVEIRSRQSSSPGLVEIDRLRDTQRYKTVLESQQHLVQERTKQIEQEVHVRREALALADKEVRVLEKLRERQCDAHAAAELHSEFLQLDEAAIQQWNQKMKARK